MHFRAVILGFHRSAPIAIIVASSSSPFPLSPRALLLSLSLSLRQHHRHATHPPRTSAVLRSIFSLVAPITSRDALIKLVTRMLFFPVARALFRPMRLRFGSLTDPPNHVFPLRLLSRHNRIGKLVTRIYQLHSKCIQTDN